MPLGVADCVYIQMLLGRVLPGLNLDLCKWVTSVSLPEYLCYCCVSSYYSSWTFWYTNGNIWRYYHSMVVWFCYSG